MASGEELALTSLLHFREMRWQTVFCVLFCFLPVFYRLSAPNPIGKPPYVIICVSYPRTLYFIQRGIFQSLALTITILFLAFRSRERKEAGSAIITIQNADTSSPCIFGPTSDLHPPLCLVHSSPELVRFSSLAYKPLFSWDWRNGRRRE